MRSNVYVGVKPGFDHANADKEQTLRRLGNNYDYLLLPVTNYRYRDTVRQRFQEFKESQSNRVYSHGFKVPEPQLQHLSIPPFQMEKNSNEDPSYIGLLSSWLELESNDTSTRDMAYKVLLNECKYARFVNIDKLIMAPPRDLNKLYHYSQIVLRLLESEAISAEPPLILSISLPLCEDSDPLATWELWNTIRKLCEYHPSLSISLALPRIKTPSHVLNRWLCEPVSCLLLSSSIFATNQHGYPVLYKFNQNLISKFQRVNGNANTISKELTVILHGMEKYADQVKGGEVGYVEYINYLLKKEDKNIMSVEHGQYRQSLLQNTNSIAADLIEDELSAPKIMPPLRPHQDDLNNTTYSVFENDHTKYELYRKAIDRALLHMKSLARSQRLVILIAGAGRGNLVHSVYQTAEELNILGSVKIIALEKNTHACLYLQRRNFDDWANSVEIVRQDMCKWLDSSIKVDLCVSELLGSFGCNELSPECLCAIEKNHSKRSTIFIPQSYSSYIAPITSPSLYQRLSTLPASSMESPWVINNIPYQISSSKVNEVWRFEHPLDYTADVLSRSVVSDFKIKHKTEIHALIGFFKATLYDDITISIVPNGQTVKVLSNKDKSHIESSSKMGHTEDLHSWSPMVFPLKTPFTVTDDTELSVMMNRTHCEEEGRVWYEWAVESHIYLVVSSSLDGKEQGYADGAQNQNINTTTTTTSSTQRFEQPQHHQTNGHRVVSHAATAAFDSAIPADSFLPCQESGWQSVQDIHKLADTNQDPTTVSGTGNPQEGIGHQPMFNLASVHRPQPLADEPQEEVHLRVRTGVSCLHNNNGTRFSMPL